MEFSRETELRWSKSLRTDGAYVNGTVWGIRVAAPGHMDTAIAWVNELQERVKHEFNHSRELFHKVSLIRAQTLFAVSLSLEVEELYADLLGPLVDRLNSIADEMMNLSFMEKQ